MMEIKLIMMTFKHLIRHFIRRTCALFQMCLLTVYLHDYEFLCLCVYVCQYADPVTDLLDQCGVFRARLFRESCVFHHGCYVKDLSRLGRQLNKTLILDNSPASYIFHPENAVSVFKTIFFIFNNSCIGFCLNVSHNNVIRSMSPNAFHWLSGVLTCYLPSGVMRLVFV